MTLKGTDKPLVELYDLLLLDLDGVVYVGPQAVPGAAAALSAARAAGLSLAYVTNNASRTPATVAEHLSSLDIPATADEVVTSAMAAAALLRARLPAGARVLVVGGEGLTWALGVEGLVPVSSMDDDPAAVVQGFSPDIGWRLLAEGTRAVRAGLPWVATNTDLTVPTAFGPAPGNGTLVAAVATASGVAPIVAGKPQPHLFLDAARRYGSKAPLVVGDRLDTDLEGARAAGMPGLAVLTGVTGVTQLLDAPAHQRPDLVGADLWSLCEAHPAPQEQTMEADGARSWRCSGAVVRVADGRLAVDEPGAVALDLLRAACAAAWQWLDDRPAGEPSTVDPAAVIRAMSGLDGSGPWAR